MTNQELEKRAKEIEKELDRAIADQAEATERALKLPERNVFDVIEMGIKNAFPHMEWILEALEKGISNSFPSRGDICDAIKDGYIISQQEAYEEYKREFRSLDE